MFPSELDTEYSSTMVKFDEIHIPRLKGANVSPVTSERVIFIDLFYSNRTTLNLSLSFRALAKCVQLYINHGSETFPEEAIELARLENSHRASDVRATSYLHIGN